MRYLAERPNRVDGGLLDFPRSVDDLFNRFWRGMVPSRLDTWRPAVDVIETPQAYLLRAEVPGIDPDDVDVTLTGDTLTIRGDKKLEEKLGDQSWHMTERLAGSFERSFNLPTPVSAKDIEAEARHGVLTIKVMKAEEAQPHRVSIRKS
ncbi:MAG: Hsp20/alpha crystallin family protein [Planctomycetota bacterium]